MRLVVCFFHNSSHHDQLQKHSSVEPEGEFGCACYDGYELLEVGVSCEGVRKFNN